MELKLIKNQKYITTTGQTLDLFDQEALEVLPFINKIMAFEQNQPKILWLKSNAVQIQCGQEVNFEGVKLIKFYDLSGFVEQKELQEFFQIEFEKFESWLKRRLITSLDELWLNYDQHLRVYNKNAKIMLAESEELVLLGLDDDLGRFTLELMSKYGLNDFTQVDYESDQSKVGGGLGIYSLMKKGNVFYGTCEWGKKSKTYVGFLKEKNKNDKTIYLEEK